MTRELFDINDFRHIFQKSIKFEILVASRKVFCKLFAGPSDIVCSICMCQNVVFVSQLVSGIICHLLVFYFS